MDKYIDVEKRYEELLDRGHTAVDVSIKDEMIERLDEGAYAYNVTDLNLDLVSITLK